MFVDGEELCELSEVCSMHGLILDTVRHWQNQSRFCYPPFPKHVLVVNRKRYCRVREINAWFRQKERLDNLIPARLLSEKMFGSRTTITSQRDRGINMPFPYAFKRPKGKGFEYFYDYNVVKNWWKQYDCKQFVRYNYFEKRAGIPKFNGRKKLEMSYFLCERCRHMQLRKKGSFWFVKEDVDRVIEGMNVNNCRASTADPKH